MGPYTQCDQTPYQRARFLLRLWPRLPKGCCIFDLSIKRWLLSDMAFHGKSFSIFTEVLIPVFTLKIRWILRAPPQKQRACTHAGSGIPRGSSVDSTWKACALNWAGQGRLSCSAPCLMVPSTSPSRRIIRLQLSFPQIICFLFPPGKLVLMNTYWKILALLVFISVTPFGHV